MSKICLENVTRIFPRSGWMDRRLTPVGGRALIGDQVDRAFAERAAAQAQQTGTPQRDGQGDIVALDHVVLTIPDGQTFAVVGPSGCGKSTLLRVVAGLDTEYTGDVYYDAQNMREVPPKDRYIGMVFQNYALYPHFEGHGNLRFFFMVRHTPDAEAEERIRITSQIMGFGFDQLLQRKPGTLSGGQQQRLAIGRAIVRNPRLFLFDEPLSNLDAKLRMQTRVEIKRLLGRFQITSIYVTHDQEEAIALGDQIAIMREGRIEQVGAFTDLLENPVNAFVAGFLGKHPMNLFEGTVAEDGTLRLGEVVVPLPAAIRARYQPNQHMVLGARPNAARLILGNYRPEPGAIRLTGEVEMVEPDFVRHSLMVFLRTDSLSYRVLGSVEEWLRPGDRVEVAFPTDRLYFFDGQTGVRISR